MRILSFKLVSLGKREFSKDGNCILGIARSPRFGPALFQVFGHSLVPRLTSVFVFSSSSKPATSPTQEHEEQQQQPPPPPPPQEPKPVEERQQQQQEREQEQEQQQPGSPSFPGAAEEKEPSATG